MNLLSAIDRRVSRRSYLNTPIDIKTAEMLRQFLLGLNVKSDLNFEFMEDGSAAFAGFRKSYGLFSGVRSLILLKGPKADKDLLEKVGYYGEQAMLYAVELNLGTCWVAGSYDRKSGIFKVPESEQLIAVITVGHAPEQTSRREKFVHSLTHRKSKSVDIMLKADCTPPDWLKAAMNAVQKAPSAANRQPVTFVYEKGVLKASVPENITTCRIDLGIAKLHFELASQGFFALGNNAVYREKQGSAPSFVDSQMLP